MGGSLFGVVLGGVITYFITRHSQVTKALHDSRILAFARFAAAAMEYRRSLMDRWFFERGDQLDAAPKDEVYETRSAAWAALFEVRLLASGEIIGHLAREAIDATSGIKDADDQLALTVSADESRSRVEAFVVAARSDIAASRRVK